MYGRPYGVIDATPWNVPAGLYDAAGGPLMTGLPTMDYHQPAPAELAPIPAVPPVEDVVW